MVEYYGIKVEIIKIVTIPTWGLRMAQIRPLKPFAHIKASSIAQMYVSKTFVPYSFLKQVN